MNITEILLIFAGVIVTVAGYLIPAGRRTNDQDKAFVEKSAVRAIAPCTSILFIDIKQTSCC